MAGLPRIRKLFPLLIFLTVCLVLTLSGTGPQLQPVSSHSPQVDPFYLKLFEDGLTAFNRGDFEEAFQNLKIAAFGFLDETDLLGETFVYLTLSAYNLKKTDQVQYYLKEISRFKLNNRITGSRLPKEIKDQFARIQSSFKNGLTG
ncbi:MAG: hypothetical protein NUW07_00635 [Candidatus Saccharicenans sp.]|jgi:hypothetical protein|nr:hypothetical protein [Candidatus Saccharicenans sp.]MDH7493557.1 hypothetical protein [Candidatus Saccharicenans sp.]